MMIQLMFTERKTFVTEDEPFVTEDEPFVTEDEPFVIEDEAFVTEKVDLTTEKEALTAEKEAFIKAKEAFLRATDALVNEKEVLIKKNKELTGENEHLVFKDKCSFVRIENCEKTIDELRSCRCTLRFPESSKPGDIYLSSYNGKAFRTKVPSDVNYKNWYTFELPYSTLPNVELDLSKERIILVDVYYRDHVFLLTKEENEEDQIFNDRIKLVEKVIFSIATIIDNVFILIDQLDKHYDNVNRLRGEINLYITELSEKYNDNSMNDQKEENVVEFLETPYSGNDERTIMETIVKKFMEINVNQIRKSIFSFNSREILKEFLDEQFRYQLELHECKNEANKTMIAKLKSKKDTIGVKLFSYAETESVVYTTQGHINQIDGELGDLRYYKNYEVSLPEGRPWGCEIGVLNQNINLVPCRHDRETDIQQKKFHFIVKKKQIYLKHDGCSCGCDSNEWGICEMPNDMCCECNSST